jgi:cell division protein ZapE
MKNIDKNYIGNIKLDDKQKEVLKHLNQLAESIREYLHLRKQKKLFNIFKKPYYPVGIYLWGSVGTGKSMLSEYFFNNVQTDKKLHVHFHKFMIDIHKSLKQLRQKDSSKTHRIDYLTQIAKNLSGQYLLIYIDELQITDITDAMIVGKLFREMLNQGIVILITSNRKPDDLYLGGLQRDSFLGFIELIKKQMHVVELSSQTDYRLEKIKSLNETYHIIADQYVDDFIKQTIEFIIKDEPLEITSIEVNGREIICKESCKNLAIFDFNQLCSANLGSEDYIAICKKFNIIIIKNIPKLSSEARNEAKRFINLIDIIYEHKIKLICTAEVPPHLIYSNIEGNEAFEFDRTISRLMEMQSEEYLNKKII